VVETKSKHLHCLWEWFNSVNGEWGIP